MAKFILVRHGQTEWNREERFRGRADLALTELGHRQAEAAGRSLRGRPIAALYCSPLRRALQTAEAISRELGIPAEPNEGLIDMDFGEFQGLSAEEARDRDSSILEGWLSTPHRVRFPGGDSLDDVRDRVVEAVHELAKKYGDGTVALVSHKVVCQVLICAMLGIDNSHFWQVGQDVCAVNAFELADGLTSVTKVNDTCHLRDIEE